MRGVRPADSVAQTLTRSTFYSASRKAKHLGRKSIEAEHLLLGIMREDHCAAAKALTTAGAPTLADVRKSISASRRPGVVTTEMIEEHQLKGELKWRSELKEDQAD